MNTRVVVGALVVLLLAGGAVAAFATGFGPAPGGDSGDTVSTPQSTGTVYHADGGSTDESSGSGGTSTPNGGGGGATDTPSGSDGTATDEATTQSTPPFAFTIDQIEACGQTCRDVTATLTNHQNDTATGVTVYTQIYAGNSTDSGNRVWSGDESVGTLSANDSYTSTNRVELSLLEAKQVQDNDGWLTIVTTVESDQTTVTFESRRDVT